MNWVCVTRRPLSMLPSQRAARTTARHTVQNRQSRSLDGAARMGCGAALRHVSSKGFPWMLPVSRQACGSGPHATFTTWAGSRLGRSVQYALLARSQASQSLPRPDPGADKAVMKRQPLGGGRDPASPDGYCASPGGPALLPQDRRELCTRGARLLWPEPCGCRPLRHRTAKAVRVVEPLKHAQA